MEKLKFSIITPSFNQGIFIEETICSIVKQGYRNFEYFVIDGGSTDSTIDVIRKYQNEITYWISEKDYGQSHALNKGFQRATGDILIWINSDDTLEPDALAKAAEYFTNHPSVDVIHGKTIIFQGTDRLIKGADESSLPYQYLAGMAFPQPSAFIRRSAIQNYHPVLNESLHYGMDYDLFASLYLNGSFLNVPDVFSSYRLHDESKTVMTNEGFARDWQKVFCKIVSTMEEFNDLRSDLVQLGMWHESSGIYIKSKKFEQEFVSKVFEQFLNFQINLFYRDLNLAEVRRIGKFMKTRFPEFYQKHNIGRIYLVSKVPFAQYLIPLVRKSSF